MTFTFGSFILMIAITVISLIVSQTLKSKFKKYSQMQLRTNLTGKEVAEMMLHDNGITDVQVIQVSGQLTDHYNPANKTVNLSESVYYERNAAAAAVAAHECGHAVQHAQAYKWLTMRSKLVPIVQVSSQLMTFVLIGGILLINTFPSLLLFGIILFAATTVFSFITLPVEFDASSRALKWMEGKNIVNSQEQYYAKDALKWAAMTYVVAAIGSLATLLYYVAIFLNRR
ncbi:MAG: zinc metallopeptidase [Bacteroidia bacterium]|jgi:Zn-dependent membrane protease YugP|nr:zinc metallopeptidase [Bacteroidia bacterium]MCO5254861.1 zinc metallopeptidase [Bacteroidota bacterium]